jgi:hypothetical protein
MATTASEIGQQVALDRIRVPDNVRTLDDAHVQALAGSITLQGMLVPVVVRDDGDARRPSSSTPTPKSCTSSWTATPTGRRRSALATTTSTKRGPPAS